MMKREIQSFVRRDGRMTFSQREAVNTLLPLFGLNREEKIQQFSDVFKRRAPLTLEIGFGGGVSLVEMAKLYPEEDFIGIETHLPGIGALLLRIQQLQLQNIRIYYADAVKVLREVIPDESLQVIQIFFPDPWPKRKHHKRRLIQPAFVELLLQKLTSKGMIHLATDWEDYAIHMMKVLSGCSKLHNLSGVGQFAERSPQRPVVTKFERRGQESGRIIWELQFRKQV